MNQQCGNCTFWNTEDGKVGTCDAPVPFAVVVDVVVETGPRDGEDCPSYEEKARC